MKVYRSFTDHDNFSIRLVKQVFFGGEYCYKAEVRHPGEEWFQPGWFRDRLADAMIDFPAYAATWSNGFGGQS